MAVFMGMEKTITTHLLVYRSDWNTKVRHLEVSEGCNGWVLFACKTATQLSHA